MRWVINESYDDAGIRRMCTQNSKVLRKSILLTAPSGECCLVHLKSISLESARIEIQIRTNSTHKRRR